MTGEGLPRRGFLGALLGAAVFDPERLLWVPGRKVISVPSRQTVHAWLFMGCASWVQPGARFQGSGSDWPVVEVVHRGEGPWSQEMVVMPTKKPPTTKQTPSINGTWAEFVAAEREREREQSLLAQRGVRMHI